jgi:hypothetical protein
MQLVKAGSRLLDKRINDVSGIPLFAGISKLIIVRFPSLHGAQT